jgi:hypothetical protein
MSDEQKTDGVRISRSTIDRSSFAIGPGARSQVIIGQVDAALRERGQEELAELLRGLQQAVQESRSVLDRPDEVEETVAHVAAQLSSNGPPNRTLLKGLLDGITAAANTAGTVVEAARALSDFVQRLS